MTTDYAAQIRELDRQYQEVTGQGVFQGVEHRGGSSVIYLFSDDSYYNGPDALDHMRELLNLVKK